MYKKYTIYHLEKQTWFSYVLYASIYEQIINIEIIFS